MNDSHLTLTIKKPKNVDRAFTQLEGNMYEDDEIDPMKSSKDTYEAELHHEQNESTYSRSADPLDSVSTPGSSRKGRKVLVIDYGAHHKMTMQESR